MNKVTVSAPGKLLLFGEHGVVYGRPCIVTAVNQRLNLTLEKIDQPLIILNAPDVDIKDYQKNIKDLGRGEIPKGAKYIEIAIRNFFNQYPKSQGLKIYTTSEFKSTFGFGSSSAATVCTIKALSEIFNIALSEKQIFDLSYKTIIDIAGIGSGVDIAAAIYGGTIYYLAGGKMIRPLNLKNLPLIIGYSGVKADTPTILKALQKRIEDKPDYYEKLFTNIEDIVTIAKNSLVSNNLKKSGEMMNLNQVQLEKLNVSSKILDDLISAARNAGAFGAKLSGAGLGDCMIALAPEDKRQAVEKAIEKSGGQVISIDVNTKGVNIEK